MTNELGFCPKCRRAAPAGGLCPDCNCRCDAPPAAYPERLLCTVLSQDTSRAGMAVDVLIKRMHEARAIVPLLMLLRGGGDPYRLVLAARGMGWLADPQAVPDLIELLLNEEKPFVARMAAAEALGKIGGEAARQALALARQSPRPSVVRAAGRAAANIEEKDRLL